MTKRERGRNRLKYSICSLSNLSGDWNTCVPLANFTKYSRVVAKDYQHRTRFAAACILPRILGAWQRPCMDVARGKKPHHFTVDALEISDEPVKHKLHQIQSHPNNQSTTNFAQQCNRWAVDQVM